MTQLLVFLVLILSLGLFLWDRIRYDFVALLALFSLVLGGLIKVEDAFSGFSHPAVITVAAVMIISKALQNSGLIDVVSRWMLNLGKNITIIVFGLSLLTALISTVMNNVGALAITLPIAIQLAQKSGHSPSKVLMPISFASILGGMGTLIGTPPNIIISAFREDASQQTFELFDFTKVGFWVILAGVLFISLAGWRLIPKRKGSGKLEESFKIDDYITELMLGEQCKLLDQSIREIMKNKVYEVNILGLIRNGLRIHIPDADEQLKLGDILILEADSENLKLFLDVSKAELLAGKKWRNETIASKDIVIREVVIMQDSVLVGNNSIELNLRKRYGVNLLAISRGERQYTKRLSESRFRAGDVILLQGLQEHMQDIFGTLGCIPLTERGHRLGDKSQIFVTLCIIGTAITMLILHLLPVQLVFSLAALSLTLSRVINVKEVYKSIDWSVIVLLGAMIPVGMALESSGSAQTIANLLLRVGNDLPVWVSITGLMVITMLLSNIINNAATAVVMAPIAIELASGLNYAIDPFLMAVAISASAAFLTPIGHQSNILVMGPGAYRFGDYWRMGLPLQILVMLVSVPLLIHYWA